ncbi:DEAD/DEAH box helicase [Candidatus Bathyarchaeota archaeon]|nr:DEAD/DEAH box helicase [Candidatus Bathyarchaeota archaeon]
MLLQDQGLSTLYPPQEEAINAGVLEGKNFVLASPTASGKTLVAELCAFKHILERGGKVLYLTPLRALASEKFEEFNAYSKLIKSVGRKIRVAISTGDYDGNDSWLGRYDIIVVTNEKCDSLLRHRSDWIDSVSLVVADEVHVLNDMDRGPTLEVTLTRLTEINPKIQILALSATIRNASEIAEWLKAGSVTTEWRPVKLVEGVYFDGECQFNDGGSIKVEDVDANPVVDLASQVARQGGQVLIFAETRARAVNYAKSCALAVGRLLSRPEKRSLEAVSEKLLASSERTRIEELLSKLVINGVAFHHAGLPSGPRKLIEDSFKEGKIKVISATPTLAAGVNLPARRAIISSYQRYEFGYGRNPITVLEYKQMAGRAGRPKYDKVGEAILIAKTADEQDYLMQSYVLAKPERIWSKLAVEKVLRGHVLASIAAAFTQSEQGVMDFFRKTFYAYQYGSEMIEVLVAKALSYLYKEKMIVLEDKALEASTFGHRVSELYIDPASAVIMREALKRGAEHVTALSFLHMICHTPDNPSRYYPRSSEVDELVAYTDLHSDEFLVPLPQIEDEVEYQAFLGEVKVARVLEAWIDEVSEDQIIERYKYEPGDLFRLIDSANWLLHATYELGRLLDHRELLSKVLEVRERVNKGVKKELLPIVRLRGVGRVRGRMLFNAGLSSIKALKEASVEEIAVVPTMGPSLAKSIKEQVGGLIKAEEWERLKSEKEWQQKSLSEF